MKSEGRKEEPQRAKKKNELRVANTGFRVRRVREKLLTAKSAKKRRKERKERHFNRRGREEVVAFDTEIA